MGSSRIWLEPDGEGDGETVGAGAACNSTASKKTAEKKLANAERISTTMFADAFFKDDR